MRTLPTLLMHASFAIGFTLVGCASTDAASTDTATSNQSAALENTQCAMQARKDDVAACRTTYDACRVADGADIQACRDALLACLPKPGEEHKKGGGPGGEHGDCDGGPPPPPSGDAGPPPPRGEGGGPGGGGPGGGGPGGEGGKGGPGGPRPDRAAMEACHATFVTCINASTDVTACFDAEHTCVKAAFDAAFQARCVDDKTKCDNGEIPAAECTKITARCAQGSDPGPKANPAPNCSSATSQ